MVTRWEKQVTYVSGRGTAFGDPAWSHQCLLRKKKGKKPCKWSGKWNRGPQIVVVEWHFITQPEFWNNAITLHTGDYHKINCVSALDHFAIRPHWFFFTLWLLSHNITCHMQGSTFSDAFRSDVSEGEFGKVLQLPVVCSWGSISRIRRWRLCELRIKSDRRGLESPNRVL